MTAPGSLGLPEKMVAVHHALAGVLVHHLRGVDERIARLRSLAS